MPIPEPGVNVEIGVNDDVAVLVNKHKEQLDELCYMWSEVKLYHLTNNELEKYLGKVDQENTTNIDLKGDNTDTTTQQDTSNQTSSPPAYSRSG